MAQPNNLYSAFQAGQDMLAYPGQAVAHMLNTRLPNYISSGADYLFGSEEHKQQERMDREDAKRFALNMDDPYWREKLTTARNKDRIQAYRASRPKEPTWAKIRQDNAQAKTSLGSDVWDQLNAINATTRPVSPQTNSAQVLYNSSGLEPESVDGNAKALAMPSGSGYDPIQLNPNMAVGGRYAEPQNMVNRTQNSPKTRAPLVTELDSDMAIERDARRAMDAQPIAINGTKQLENRQLPEGSLGELGRLTPEQLARVTGGRTSKINPSNGKEELVNQGLGQSPAVQQAQLDSNQKGTFIVARPDRATTDREANQAAFAKMYPNYTKDDTWKYSAGDRQSRAYNLAGLADPDNMKAHNMQRASEGHIDMTDNNAELKRMGIHRPPVKDKNYLLDRANEFAAGTTGGAATAPVAQRNPSYLGNDGLQTNSYHTRIPQKNNKPIRDGFIDEYMKRSMR